MSPIPVVTQKVDFLKFLKTLVFLQIKQNGIYTIEDLITFHAIKPICLKADGLSAPKVITVLGSDGKCYKIIFKVYFILLLK